MGISPDVKFDHSCTCNDSDDADENALTKEEDLINNGDELKYCYSRFCGC